MAIKSEAERPVTEKKVIDLQGPEGNAFYILGVASKLSSQLDLDKEDILNEMKSGDYENLITVFDKHFGDYIDLQR